MAIKAIDIASASGEYHFSDSTKLSATRSIILSFCYHFWKQHCHNIATASLLAVLLQVIDLLINRNVVLDYSTLTNGWNDEDDNEDKRLMYPIFIYS